MNITISEKAKQELQQSDTKNLKIYLKGYG